MLFETLSSLGGWSWLITALVLFTLELIAPGFFLLWIGLAAAVTGGLVMLIDMPFLAQLGIFALASVASGLLAKRVFHYGNVADDKDDLNHVGKQHIGRVGTVEDPIVNGRGRVRVGDSLWAAEGPDVGAGARVRVSAVKGTVLVVEAV